MLNTTLEHVSCPVCRGKLILKKNSLAPHGATAPVYDVLSGDLRCTPCNRQYPILGGVAILVEDVRGYLLEHVKGIAQIVPDSEIPKRYRQEYIWAKSEIQKEHIEEDLEAERVISLYLANHYLKATDSKPGSEWWKASSGPSSPLIDELIRKYWDHGPMAQIDAWTNELGQTQKIGAVVELGCGVAGVSQLLKGKVGSYLGLDSSFASIALGRHLALGAPYPKPLCIPNDLIQGPLTKKIKVTVPATLDPSVDLIVGNFWEGIPLALGQCDCAIALNTIDMMPKPELLPQLQFSLLKSNGLAIQSCPYIWHETVAKNLRKVLPPAIRDSGSAVEWLYEQAGFEIFKKVDHLPWLFFKHSRQLEIYSVQIFSSRKI